MVQGSGRNDPEKRPKSSIQREFSIDSGGPILYTETVASANWRIRYSTTRGKVQ